MSDVTISFQQFENAFVGAARKLMVHFGNMDMAQIHFDFKSVRHLKEDRLMEYCSYLLKEDGTLVCTLPRKEVQYSFNGESWRRHDAEPDAISTFGSMMLAALKFHGVEVDFIDPEIEKISEDSFRFRMSKKLSEDGSSQREYRVFVQAEDKKFYK